MTPLVEVSMVREDLVGLPSFPLPAPYALRPYQPGDVDTWLRVQRQAEEHHSQASLTPALFLREFGDGHEPLRQRQLFLSDGAGHEIGTATAWWNPRYRGTDHGRIHWVAIVPQAQGLGLGRPLISALCQRFVQLGHRRAYLTTETVRRRAIHLYQCFGFVPEIKDEADRRAWREIGAIP